jgi:uncharacterized membrane protein HdeD (DUF308 family)
MADTFAFILGFLSLNGGINRLAASALPQMKGTRMRTWLIINGVISLIIGIFFFCAPLASFFAMDMLLGIYLIIGGAGYAVEVFTAKKRA